MPSDKATTLKQDLEQAIKNESEKFHEYYLWLEKAMSPLFFEEVDRETVMLITHNLMGFDLQDHFSAIHLKNAAVVLCLDSPDADLRILQNYALYGIKNYQVYNSISPPPFEGVVANLRIALIQFTEIVEKATKVLPQASLEELRLLTKQRNPSLTDEGFDQIITSINARFLGSMPIERLALALDMYFRAQTRDNCQYEVRYNESWKERDAPSLQIVLAWRNTPKYNFLYRLARTINRHKLVMKRVNATYISANIDTKESILVMSLGLHGADGQAVWDAANISDFLRELLTVKYFASFDVFDTVLVSKGIISGSMGNLLRSMSNFIHQMLVHLDPNLYTLQVIQEDLCRHPDLTAKLCEAFNHKFHPLSHSYETYIRTREQFLTNVNKLDTGQEQVDNRRKTVLKLGMNFVHYTLKTNFYRTNLTAHCFRLNPQYLDELPFDRTKKFPELPYAIFFAKGMHFFGFHIRFKDLARGGLRTVYPELPEQALHERNNIFLECYNLAFTQHLKNKDIPEGGAKGILFLNPLDRLETESIILQKEMEAAGINYLEIQNQMNFFRKEQKVEYLHQAQRSFIESILTIVNCDADGTIRAKNIVDYWKRPEYLYLGPDENMHDEMILWIAALSKKYSYKPGSAFISSKPYAGINHKNYGVTSLGVNVYMEELLKFIGINPYEDTFTIKMSGGPDGDVAGNQICNLHRYYPKTAKLLTIVDISGTIYDPEGLKLDVLVELFGAAKPINFYPPELLSNGGLLLNKSQKRSLNSLSQQTLCWRKQAGQLEKEWLSGSEMNHLLRETLNQTKTDVFIPGGGGVHARWMNRMWLNL